jgi:hypothetical protein
MVIEHMQFHLHYSLLLGLSKNISLFFLWTTRLYLFQRINMTNKKYHTVGTVKKSNRKIVERGNRYLYHTDT